MVWSYAPTPAGKKNMYIVLGLLSLRCDTTRGSFLRLFLRTLFYVVAHDRAITDFNELTHHFINVIKTHIDLVRPPTPMAMV